MKFSLPEDVTYIIDTFYKKGFEAYIVGGCIRDLCLDKIPKDYDITSSALPEDVIKLFNHTAKTGVRYGTITVIMNGRNYEVTTYRLEGKYSDSRHPDKVLFTDNIYDDLKRRDFSMNAMAYNSIKGLLDPFNGTESIQKKEIICVGDPDKRFKEDALRMLRAVRFSCELNFHIEKNTYSSIVKNCSLIKNISVERIQCELIKILLSEKPSNGIRTLYNSGLMDYIIPETECCVGFDQHNPHHDKDVFEHILSVLDNTPKNISVRLSALFHDIGKPLCFSIDEKGIGHFYKHNIISAELSSTILKRLKFDNNTIKKVFILIKEHMNFPNPENLSSIKKFIKRVGIENVDDLISLQIADKKGKKPPFEFDSILNIKNSIKKIINENQPFSIKQLDISGNDIKKLGIPQGKQIGNTLNCLLDLTIDNPALNKKEKLTNIVIQMLHK